MLIYRQKSRTKRVGLGLFLLLLWASTSELSFGQNNFTTPPPKAGCDPRNAGEFANCLVDGGLGDISVSPKLVEVGDALTIAFSGTASPPGWPVILTGPPSVGGRGGNYIRWQNLRHAFGPSPYPIITRIGACAGQNSCQYSVTSAGSTEENPELGGRPWAIVRLDFWQGGLQSWDEDYFGVKAPVLDPIASFAWERSALDPLTVLFDAASSSDTDGNIVSYEWDFGDTGSGGGQMTNHEYSEAGDFVVTLTVTDNDGLQDTNAQTITAGETKLMYSLDVDPPVVVPGDTIAVVIDAINAGSSSLTDLVATVTEGGGGGVIEKLSEPDPRSYSNIEPGDTLSFVSQFVGVSVGKATLDITVSAQNSNRDSVEGIPFCASGKQSASQGCTNEVEVADPVAFTAASAFQEEDELYWPDSTYTILWSAGISESVDIDASTRKNASPFSEADWTIPIASRLDATQESFDWKVPADLESPTVWLRIRDSDDFDAKDMSRRGRVRYGWHLYRIADDGSGELVYEAFETEKHGWQDGLTLEKFVDWKDEYLEKLALKKDDIVSETLGRPIEHGPRMDKSFWGKLYRLEGQTRSREMEAYLKLRAEGATRTVWRFRGRFFGGTPSWRAFTHALGLANVYGSFAPEPVKGVPVEEAEVSPVSQAIVSKYFNDYYQTGNGLCYGLSWSALAAFHDPESFKARFEDLYPALTVVRELSTLPIIPETLDIIGSALVMQESEAGRNFMDVIPRLKVAFESDTGDDDMVFSSGRHAVLPYRIERKGANDHRVFIRDRTLPTTSTDRYIFYSSEEFVDYTGAFSGKYATSYERLENFFQPVELPGQAQTVAITPYTLIEPTTLVAGKSDQVVAREKYRNDPDLPPVGYDMPKGPFEAALHILSDTTGAYFEMRANDGVAYGYEREDATTGDVDSIRYSPDNGLVFLGNDSPKDIVLSMSSTLPSSPSKRSISDQLFADVGPMKVGPEESVSISWNRAGASTASIRLQNHAEDQAYSVVLEHVSDKHALFVGREIEIEANALHTLRPSWDHLDAELLKIDVDRDADGTVDATLHVENQAVTTAKDAFREMPNDYVLDQNYPNPFNPSTTISYTLPTPARVRLSVFDILGREVRILVDGLKSTGHHDAVFNARDLPSGVYVYRLRAPGRQISNKMLLLK